MSSPSPEDRPNPPWPVRDDQKIATAVAFLASDEAAFITGQVLAVDGGLVMM